MRDDDSSSRNLHAPLVSQTTAGSLGVVDDVLHLSPAKIAAAARARILAGQPPSIVRTRHMGVSESVNIRTEPDSPTDAYALGEAVEDNPLTSSRPWIEGQVRPGNPESIAPPRYTEHSM
jgi:hypothetical protein